MKRTHIVAAIILDKSQQNIFITKRGDHQHQGGFWEFPGGKVEAGESAEQGLIRELFEEIGIEVTQSQIFEHFDYDYPDKKLVFDFFVVTEFSGEAFGKEGQQGQWVAINQLNDYEFPAANKPIVEKVMSCY